MRFDGNMVATAVAAGAFGYWMQSIAAAIFVVAILSLFVGLFQREKQ